MDCRPEQVTAYVDGALDGAARRAVEAHLSRPCLACRAQASADRGIRQRLRGLPSVEPRPDFVRRLRGLLRTPPPPGVLLLVLAAGLGLLAALISPQPASIQPGLH